MSFYATIHGEIAYEKREDFEAAVKILDEGGWIKDGKFIDECGEVISGKDIHEESRVINIPYFCHRNLSRVLNELFIGGKGEVIWTSTDGCFDGGVIRNGIEEYHDLRKWAADNNDTLNVESVPEDSEDFDALCDYMQIIEDEFHASF